MRDRLIELLKQWSCHYSPPCDGECYECHKVEMSARGIEHIADHLLAAGCILPPCKVGDVLYVVTQTRDKRILPFINEYEATSIGIGKKKCLVYHEMDGFIKNFKQDDFGKTVFLTREEAEKAINERRY